MVTFEDVTSPGGCECYERREKHQNIQRLTMKELFARPEKTLDKFDKWILKPEAGMNAFEKHQTAVSQKMSRRLK